LLEERSADAAPPCGRIDVDGDVGHTAVAAAVGVARHGDPADHPLALRRHEPVPGKM
jgi:hypothetical protein